MAVSTFTKTGTKSTTSVKLEKTIFDIEVTNHSLLKSAYVAYLANGRTSNAVVKTRGLVSGGGRKPWKQKGTGRARFGSTRNPIWRGGGIVFGPTGNENYKHSISTADKRLAVRQALSVANKSNKISVIESIDVKDGKTKNALSLFSKLGLEGSILIVVSKMDESLLRATGNISNVNLINAKYLNVFHILNADNIVITKDAVSEIHDWLKTETKSIPKKGDA
jgi:large subunit ribosomal protein L4